MVVAAMASVLKEAAKDSFRADVARCTRPATPQVEDPVVREDLAPDLAAVLVLVARVPVVDSEDLVLEWVERRWCRLRASRRVRNVLRTKRVEAVSSTRRPKKDR